MRGVPGYESRVVCLTSKLMPFSLYHSAFKVMVNVAFIVIEEQLSTMAANQNPPCGTLKKLKCLVPTPKNLG